MLKPLYRAVTSGPALLRNRLTTATFDEKLHVYIVSDDRSLNNHFLSLLPQVPNPEFAIGTTTQVPPTPDSLKENPRFLDVLHSVLSDYAHQDPGVISQAKALASSSGSNLGSGGAFFPQQRQNRGAAKLRSGGIEGDGAGGTNSQGGAGGGGRGGYIHVYDERNPPSYGRIPWPEDIFGSLEVDSSGNFVDGKGRYQSSGTYRIFTKEGLLESFSTDQVDTTDTASGLKQVVIS